MRVTNTRRFSPTRAAKACACCRTRAANSIAAVSPAADKLRIEFIEKALNRARELAAEQLSDESNAKLVAKTFDDVTAGKTA